MGYFPNGEAGRAYEAKWCDRCIHQDGPDGDSGCAVWCAHLMGNYEECNKPDSILHQLIPRDGITNKKCLMYEPFQSASNDDGSVVLDEGGVGELARVRTALKAGKCDDGRERLERVLGDLDPAWRTLA